MFSRRGLRAYVQDHFDLGAIPILYESDVIASVGEILHTQPVNKSDFCRMVFCDKRLRPLAELPQRVIARFLGVSEGLVSRCKAQSCERGAVSCSPPPGRPPSFPPRENRRFGNGCNRKHLSVIGQLYENSRSQ
jgi:hypothetical protein